MSNLQIKLCVPDLESHIKRFPRRYRKRIRGLTRDCSYMADLLISFPAAVFAIATGYGAKEGRAIAIRLIRNGQPLRLIANALKLPFWLRKAPPEALRKDLQPFPECPNVIRKLSGSFPQKPEDMANWLEYVLQAFMAGPPEFAIWLAKQKIFGQEKNISALLSLLTVYAWYSFRLDTCAGGMIENPWNRHMDFRTAACYAANWFMEIKSGTLYGKHGVSDCWLRPGKAGGFNFVPLMSPKELKHEGISMQNCVADYTLDVIRSECRIFSIRRGGRQVATLEIQVHHGHAGMPTITQLYGPNNEEAGERVWKATFAWLANQSQYKLPGHRLAEPDQQVWEEFWTPYWEVHGVQEGLPKAVNLEVLDQMTATLGRY